MTSTSFNVGLTDNTRLSSRVLRPPGGGHTDIFGGSEPEATRGRRAIPSAANAGSLHVAPKTTNGTDTVQNGQVTEAAPEPQVSEPVTQASEPVAEVAKPDLQVDVQSNSEAPQGSPKQAVAPKQEFSQSDSAKADPPKRVRVPPGGFSSGLW